MIVYGDRERCSPSAHALNRLADLCDCVASAHGTALPALHTQLLIEVGCVTQGLLDAEQARTGSDERNELTEVCHQLCRCAARPLVRTPAGEFESAAWMAALRAVLQQVRVRAPASKIIMREPEGYAHYGLYPEQYAAAAQRCARELPDLSWCVLGLRSIGTSLAALVSEQLGATLFWTLRPVGHPYQRELAVGAGLTRWLLSAPSACQYAVVDDGPGRSGSSFAAVFSWLTARGVDARHIHFFPSHPAPPGAHAGPTFRAAYARAERHHASFDESFGQAQSTCVARWFEVELGRVTEPVQVLSGGAWRSARYAEPADYPASYVTREAHKYLLASARGDWLAKQVGLGASARRCCALQRALAEAGFAPEFGAARGGFMLLRWHGAARSVGDGACARELLLSTVSGYLTFLARNCPAQGWSGARPAALLAMFETNASALLGASAALEAALSNMRETLPWLERRHTPVITDGKLDEHEWLYLAAGRILKCDAAQHWRGHDMIGCQDPAWDAAGAACELSLNATEEERLWSALARATRLEFPAVKRRFYRLAYLAFRAAFAASVAAELSAWPEDARRLSLVRTRYLTQLTTALSLG